MATTTANAIRDRAIAVIRALTPKTVKSSFNPFRNEAEGDFQTWCLNNPAAAFRRFQVRTHGSDRPVEVSNTDVEAHYLDLEVMVAYPQNTRIGTSALDRDDAIDQDRHQIEHAVGLAGYGNFSSAVNPAYPDAAFIAGSQDRLEGNGIDFLVIKQTFLYYRAMP